ncbi:MAG: peroxidase-related enzyme [Acidobacteriaceae bacterium]|nr:peroxidase-related enzyme [Acidobacteriaceae bacterium]
MSYLRQIPHDEVSFPLFGEIKKAFGFIPNFYRAQTLRTDLVEAEAHLVYTALFKDGALAREEREYVFLVCAAASLNTYCVTLHCEIVRMLKIEGPEPETIALDHNATDLPMRTKALLNFALGLTHAPHEVRQTDIEALRTYGYSDLEILETIAIIGVARMTAAIAFGVGAVPDFDNPRVAFAKAQVLEEEVDIFA